MCVCGCVCVCGTLLLGVFPESVQGAKGLISRPLPTKLREVETGKRTCSGRHGHISAACGHKHHVVQSMTMHVHVFLA